MSHTKSTVNTLTKRTHIELFAGCGGLSLGLKSEGFELTFANELSPMAGETFAYNILNEDLRKVSKENSEAQKTKWLSSGYDPKELLARLNENPIKADPNKPKIYDEKPKDIEDIKGKLLIGSIIDLNEHLIKKSNLKKQIKDLNVDLVSGGPPCQGFSMAGLRDIDDIKNSLPFQFSQFVKSTKPKIAVLENVTGILRGFTSPNDSGGEKHYAWHEVAKSFASIDYIPLCLHVNAMHAGVAQSRPRFIMICLNKDTFKSCKERFKNNVYFSEILVKSWKFYSNVKIAKRKNTLKTLSKKESGIECWDTSNKDHWKYFQPSSPLQELLKYTEDAPNKDNKPHFCAEAINDLCLSKNGKVYGRYRALLETSFFEDNETKRRIKNLTSKEKNRNTRNHKFKTQQRFRLLQILESIKDDDIKRGVSDHIRRKRDSLTKSMVEELMKNDFLQESGELTKFEANDTTSLKKHIKSLQTSKHTQRALVANKPSPAALTIPDDYCHYSPKKTEARTLSVREMARIQSFPDWFIFRNKETTGGERRSFETPQYTQVGNAVPPLLGKAIGKTVKELLTGR